MKKYKWGVIGTGKIAELFCQALAGCEDAVLYAVASRTHSKADNFAEKHGFEKAYGSYKELAVDDSVDAVYIATPMASHFNDAELCIKSGRNVLCEKSLTLNAAQTKYILDLAKSQNVFFMEAMWMKCRPVYLKVMDWIRSGCIGEVKYIKADFSNFIPYNKNDRLFRSDCGGGALLDLGVYPLTLAHAILGSPDEIISFANIGSDNVDLSNTITLKYNGGAVVSSDNGFELQLNNNALISGTKGFITMGNWFHCTDEAVLYSRDSKVIEKFVCKPDINGYEYEIREVHRCLSEELTESPLVPHSDTLGVMEIMDECRRQWGMKFINE